MKPESRKPGRKVAIMPICVASSWVRETAEMNRPRPSVPIRNANEAPSRNSGLPRKGTWKRSTPSDRAERHVHQADAEVGQELAEHDLGARHRRGRQLLHGAALPLARDGERGEQARDDHHDHRHQAGHDHVAARQLLVVPDAGLGADRQAHAPASAAGPAPSTAGRWPACSRARWWRCWRRCRPRSPAPARCARRPGRRRSAAG